MLDKMYSNLCSIRLVVVSENAFISLVRLCPEIEPISCWALVYVENASGTNQKHDVEQEACCDGGVSHTSWNKTEAQLKRNSCTYIITTHYALQFRLLHKYQSHSYWLSVCTELFLCLQLPRHRKAWQSPPFKSRWPPRKLLFWTVIYST